jgi:prevent-host-death family protein
MDEFEMGRHSGDDRIAHLIRLVEKGEAFTITKDGKAVAVVLSIEDYTFVRESIAALVSG